MALFLFKVYQQTKAIVLYANRYPKGYIVHLYTQTNGRIVCVANVSHGRKSSFKKVLLQPLSIIDTVIENNNSIYRIKEASYAAIYNTLPYDYIKNATALFIAEFLSLVIKEQQPDEYLFSFIEQSLQFFDMQEKGIANFHIAFLIQLSHFLGFSPNTEYCEGDFFDLLEGCFVTQRPIHQYILEPQQAYQFLQIMRINYSNLAEFKFSRNKRAEILQQIVLFYRLHSSNFRYPKSISVLEKVFD